jgi:cell division septation protein DedD
MPKPATEKKTTKKKTTPQPIIVVTGKNAFGWMLSLFVVCGCMFVIGVLVGRGQAPVQFDTQEWEQDLKNLKISVLAKQEQILESIEHIDILDFLKEKGKTIQGYKQYIPPLLSPKYGKNPPAPDTRPVAGELSLPEGSGEQSVAAMTVKPPATAPDQSGTAETATTANMADMDVISGEGPAMETLESPETPDTEAIAGIDAEQTPVYAAIETFAGQAPDSEAIQEDLEKPAPATEDMIAVKTPATSKPSVMTPLSTPVAEDAYPSLQSPASLDRQPTAVLSPGVAASVPASTDLAGPSLQYAIQVASLRELDKANTVRDKFRARGYPAYCQSSEVRGVIWHRVRIGPYPDRHTADQDCMRLKEVGVDALVFVLER